MEKKKEMASQKNSIFSMLGYAYFGEVQVDVVYQHSNDALELHHTFYTPVAKEGGAIPQDVVWILLNG